MRNLIITMFLGGLWHGAAWTFVVWGLYHGALLAVHATLKRRGLLPSSRALGIAATFLCVMVGWVFFRAESLPSALSILGAMIGTRGVESIAAAKDVLATPYILWIFAGLVGVFSLPNTWQMKYPRSTVAALGLAALFAICVLRFATPSPFIYYQF
jgi:alginate O-acetyltransferase complex protein AlgI